MLRAKRKRKDIENCKNTSKSIRYPLIYCQKNIKISIRRHQVVSINILLGDSVASEPEQALPHLHLPLLLNCFCASVEKTLGLYRSDHPGFFCPENSLRSNDGNDGMPYKWPNFIKLPYKWPNLTNRDH